MGRYQLGAMTFFTKDQIRAYVRDVLATAPLGVPLGGEDEALVRDLLDWHPKAEDKKGCGVASLAVAKGPMGSRHFILTRTDGTTTDFSYRKCIQAPTHWYQVVSAARWAIQPQIWQVKTDFFALHRTPESRRCPLTGQVMEFVGCHVDHDAPQTFDWLLREFFRVSAYDMPFVEFMPPQDNQTELHFEPVLEGSWQDFHAAHAKLRVVSAEGHQSLQTIANPGTKQALAGLWRSMEQDGMVR